MAHMTGSESHGGAQARNAGRDKTTCPICHGSGKVEGAYCACPAGSRLQQAEAASSDSNEGE